MKKDTLMIFCNKQAILVTILPKMKIIRGINAAGVVHPLTQKVIAQIQEMMGEYIIYYQGKIVGGIYDDRFLVKPVKSASKLMPNAEHELTYEGAKEMLLVDDVDILETVLRGAEHCRFRITKKLIRNRQIPVS